METRWFLIFGGLIVLELFSRLVAETGVFTEAPDSWQIGLLRCWITGADIKKSFASIERFVAEVRYR
ncbi:hypothetical protein [Blastopirellula marina]|uniref:Uncharacterized protein n=1 Tax=Blastopirellula marina TaxID=124 RepID=A0A2S8FNB1_9BACT|nr:hypothetical protein [Blastopirellula marina]PQO33688.1 hypothetical protein C5Y98_15745 [Blastopirellula marina]PTL43475.1 hypothetical protein C5Y97_15755 [Blastopirellula marina]